MTIKAVLKALVEALREDIYYLRELHKKPAGCKSWCNREEDHSGLCSWA